MIPMDLLYEHGAVTKELQSGEFIYEEGAAPNFYYEVVSGRVRLSNFMADGKEVIQKILGEFEPFGHISIFNAKEHLMSAVADCESVIIKLSAGSFLDILFANPYLMQNFIGCLSKDVHFKLFLTKLMCTASPENLLWSLLEYLKEEGMLVCQDCNKLLLTRQKLANLTGLRVETVIRALKQLERDGKIKIIHGKVICI